MFPRKEPWGRFCRPSGQSKRAAVDNKWEPVCSRSAAVCNTRPVVVSNISQRVCNNFSVCSRMKNPCRTARSATRRPLRQTRTEKDFQSTRTKQVVSSFSPRMSSQSRKPPTDDSSATRTRGLCVPSLIVLYKRCAIKRKLEIRERYSD